VGNERRPDRFGLGFQAKPGPTGGCGCPTSVCGSAHSRPRNTGWPIALNPGGTLRAVDLDATSAARCALLPWPSMRFSFGGVLYVASKRWPLPTGHDRPRDPALGACRAAPISKLELAAAACMGVIARTAWAMGRGLEPLLSFQ